MSGGPQPSGPHRAEARAGLSTDGERLADQVGIEGIDRVLAFHLPLTTRFRGIVRRRGLLLHGHHGWGEWSPFDEYEDDVAAVWLGSALASARDAPPAVRRATVPVNVTVPAVDADTARTIVAGSGCSTAKVKVAHPGQSITDDVARVAAVRQALGSSGRIRVDANAAWTADEAVDALRRIEEAAEGLEYAEQPCVTLDELATVRARTGVAIAADESIRNEHAGPEMLRAAVDIAIVKVQPAGGIAAALSLAADVGLPVVVSSALETSVGLAAGLRLAAALDGPPLACGLATGLLLATDLVRAPLLPVDGMIAVGASSAASMELRDDLPAASDALEQELVARLRRAMALRA